jgi:hypothetical protein
MIDTMTSSLRRLSRLAPALVLLAGCRDRAPADTAATTDSALIRDLAMAQRQLPPQTVFNDAPVGSVARAEPRAVAPAPRVRTPKPAPAPRREAPSAPVARRPRPSRPEPVPEPTAPARTPASNAGVIGAGSRVGMTFHGRACALTALAGDKFTATVSDAIVGTNGAVIPAGATVVLEVSSVERAAPAERSRIRFHVRAIDVNGESYPGEGQVVTLSSMEPVRVSGGSGRTKVVGGAVAGAVLGRILGGSTKGAVIGAAAGAAAGTAAARHGERTDACLADGSSLELTLSREIVMRRDGGA